MTATVWTPATAGTSATTEKPATAEHWSSIRAGMAAIAWTPVISGTPAGSRNASKNRKDSNWVDASKQQGHRQQHT